MLNPCTKRVNYPSYIVQKDFVSRLRLMASAVLRTVLFIYLDTANICDKLMNENKNMVTMKTVSFLPKSPVTNERDTFLRKHIFRIYVRMRADEL